VQVAAAVIVSAVLTPLLTSWMYRRVNRARALAGLTLAGIAQSGVEPGGMVPGMVPVGLPAGVTMPVQGPGMAR